MSTSKGVLCGAGFETPAEALYMQKKLLIVPMKGQYEQQCNAAALEEMGIPIIKSLKEKHLPKVMDWVGSSKKIEVDYPDITKEIVQKLIQKSLQA
jgi:uncharacterized protein (TIGR00661 family)